jgi:hypothetical protein
MRAQYSAALSAMRSDARREATARVALERQALAEQGRNHRAAMQIQAAQARAAAAQEARIARDLNRQRQREEAASVRAKQSAEAAVVRAAENSARQQQRAFSRMLREKVSEERRAAAESDRLQRQQTANADRALRARLADQTRAYREESRLRQQAANAAMRDYRQQQRAHERTTSGRGAAIGRGLGAAGSAAVGVGTNVHGQMVDARRQIAESQQALYRALVESGATGADAARLSRAAVTQSSRAGIDPQALLGGIARAQTEFSVLGSADERADMTAQQRTASVEDALRNAMRQGITGQRLGGDPGETLRLAGMFRQSGFDPDMIDDLLSRTTALAQRGAVEMSAVTAQSMAAIQRRMSQAGEAAGPNATAQQRREAMRSAYIQTFAEQQILRSRGFTPRAAGNAMAAMNAALMGTRTSEAMITNLRTVSNAASASTPEGQARRRQIAALMDDQGAGGLFEADPERQGQRRLRSQYRGNALALSEALARAGLDSTTTGNIFAGGGQGNRQALQANWRQLMGAMLATNAQGVSGAAATRELMQGNLTPDDRRRLENANANDPMADYIRREGERLDALTNNTGAIGRLSQSIENFTARNPITTAVGGGAASAATSVVGGLALPWVGRGIARGASYLWNAGRMALGAGGAAAAGGVGGGAGGAAGGATTAATGTFLAPALAALAGALVFAGGTSGVVSGQGATGEQLSTGERVTRGVVGATGAGMAAINLYDSFRRALQETPVQVVVDPHSAQQITSTNASRNASGGR